MKIVPAADSVSPLAAKRLRRPWPKAFAFRSWLLQRPLLSGLCAWFGLCVCGAGPLPTPYLAVIGPGPLRFQALPKAMPPPPPLALTPPVDPIVPAPVAGEEPVAVDPAAALEVESMISTPESPETTSMSPFSTRWEDVVNRVTSAPSLTAPLTIGQSDGTNAIISPLVFLEFFRQKSSGPNQAGATAVLPVEFVPPHPLLPPPSSKATLTTSETNREALRE